MVSAAISIAARFLPDLIGKVFESDKAEAVAEAITQAAMGKYGEDAETSLAKYMIELENNPAARAELSSLVKFTARLAIEDVQDARRQPENGDDKLTYVIIVLSYIGMTAVIACLVYVATLTLEAGVLAAIAAVLGSAITLMQQQIQQITNFKYGSSVGSKVKDVFGK